MLGRGLRSAAGLSPSLTVATPLGSASAGTADVEANSPHSTTRIIYKNTRWNR